MKIRGISIFKLVSLCILYTPFLYAATIKNIVVTNTILQNIVQEIIGHKAHRFDLHVIADRNASPHHHMITRHDRIKIIQSDLIIANGLNFEQRIQHVIDQVHHKVYYASSSMKHGEVIKNKGVPDPHIWLDPVIWVRVIKKVGELIQILDKKNSKYYSENALKLYNNVLDLHKKYNALLKNSKIHVIIVEHNSYGYLARRYNLDVRYLISANLESGVSYKTIEGIMNFMIENNIFTVLKEAILPSRYLNILKSYMTKLGYKIDIGNILYVDTLSAKGINSTYYGMMYSNLSKIYEVLNQVK